jgi:hypothetical protein
VVIRALRARRRPAWYRQRALRAVSRIVAANPGFHRLIITIDGQAPHDTRWMVNPDAECDIRRSLSRVLVLAPPVEDDHPWTML